MIASISLSYILIIAWVSVKDFERYAIGCHLSYIAVVIGLLLCVSEESASILLAQMKYWSLYRSPKPSIFPQPQKVNRRQAPMAHWTRTVSLYIASQTRNFKYQARLPVEAARSWQGGERQRKRHFAPRASFFVLYIWTSRMRAHTRSIPEAVKERLSHIPRHQYDKNAKIGLNTITLIGKITAMDSSCTNTASHSTKPFAAWRYYQIASRFNRRRTPWDDINTRTHHQRILVATLTKPTLDNTLNGCEACQQTRVS